ncbi:hypothetical protein LTR36_006168 [Oleoguttula mirabilis]|uniref:YDG domain-containing protein n=1 Tax=Oleoguttula mirabilis TaxID=1507867 RepID=A0AAV9JCW1_9PEZI|nr:hypothetical protein LTR36_006168 [Oleoguttula mirabilis]
MGAEQSKEEKAEIERRYDAKVEAKKAEREPALRAEYKAKRERRDARLAAEAAAAKAKETVTADVRATKKPELVRSSKSDAAPKRASRQPFIVEDDDDDDEDDDPKPTQTATNALAAFQSRKQPRDKAAAIPDSEKSSSEDEFVGFGNVLSTQQAASTPTATTTASKVPGGNIKQTVLTTAGSTGSTGSSAAKQQSGANLKQTVLTTAGSTGNTGSSAAKQQSGGKLAAPSTTSSTKQQVKSTPKAPLDFFKGAQQPDKVKATSADTKRTGQLPSRVKLAPLPTIATNVAKASTTASINSSASPPSETPATALPKRPTSNAFVDERRESVRKVPKRAAAASPQSPDGAASNPAGLAKMPKKSAKDGAAAMKQNVTAIEERPPKWYNSLKPANRKPEENNADTLMKSLRTDIKKCKDATPANAQQLFARIGNALHTLPLECVSGQLLRNNRMLHNEDGLPQLFDKLQSGGVAYPKYIEEDAEALYNKWSLADFNTDPHRGIIPGTPGTRKNGNKDKTVDSLEQDYEDRINPKFHGNGILLNGNCWPTQLTTVRDGAHGHSIAGIAGAKGEGAYSCIMSSGLDPSGREYPDKDDGDNVLYCGTDSTDGAITKGTEYMLESERSGKPVRLLRSHNLKSPFAPDIGFRYDGLYTVVSSEDLDGATNPRRRHQFKLVRLAGQNPIRSDKPTVQEKGAWKKDRRLRGYN